MITCTVRYQVDPTKLADFEAYGAVWITLVNRMGGTHHGYFLPHEGASDLAYALFSFPSLAAYESYRAEMAKDADCQQAYEYAAKSGCIIRYDRFFQRPVLDGADPDILSA